MRFFFRVHSCYKDLFCSIQPACENGRLFDCQFYDADAWVCLSKSKTRFHSIKLDSTCVKICMTYFLLLKLTKLLK